MITRVQDLPPTRRGWREIHRYGYPARRFDEVWPLLAGGAERLLGAEADADGCGLELRVTRAGIDLPRTVRVHVGAPVHLGDHAVVPLSWSDFRHPRLFPVLRAVLEFAPADYGRRSVTQVGLLGRYRSPLGPFGEAVDRMAGAEIVAESVGAFVDDLAERIEAEVEPASSDHEPAVVEDGGRRIFLPLSRLRVRAGGAVASRRRLALLPGVRTVDLDPIGGMAVVTYDPHQCNLDDLAAWADD